MGHSPGKRPILEPNLKARRGPVPNTSPLGMGVSLMSRPHHPVRRAPFMRVMDDSVAQSPPDHLRFAADLDETNGTPDRSRRSVFRQDGIQTPGEPGQREAPPSASLTGRSLPPDRPPFLLRTDEVSRPARMISRLQ